MNASAHAKFYAVVCANFCSDHSEFLWEANKIYIELNRDDILLIKWDYRGAIY